MEDIISIAAECINESEDKEVAKEKFVRKLIDGLSKIKDKELVSYLEGAYFEKSSGKTKVILSYPTKEFCPKVCCSGEVDIDTIAKKLAEKIEQEMASFKGFFEEDEKQVEDKPTYILIYECGKEIKQERIVVESLEEAMDIITELDFAGFHTVGGKAIYIKTDNIVEIREYDAKQDELVKLTPEVRIKLNKNANKDKDVVNIEKKAEFIMASNRIEHAILTKNNLIKNLYRNNYQHTICELECAYNTLESAFDALIVEEARYLASLR